MSPFYFHTMTFNHLCRLPIHKLYRSPAAAAAAAAYMYTLWASSYHCYHCCLSCYFIHQFFCLTAGAPGPPAAVASAVLQILLIHRSAAVVLYSLFSILALLPDCRASPTRAFCFIAVLTLLYSRSATVYTYLFHSVPIHLQHLLYPS